jgi:hypothetical protein
LGFGRRAQAAAAGKAAGIIVMNAFWRGQTDAVGNDTGADLPGARTATVLWVTAVVLRSAFILALMVLTLRVSMPQNGTFWRLYDTPSDAVRLALAIAVCIWLATQLFRAPKDAHACRTWLVLGVFAAPFVVILLIAVW